ncbi:MAG TPA: SpoIID/LytB domain-containing protein [Acidobacteriota bacterium]|nr:SpoIID/LytB domain-containing protein [Acidobacteriota bacterium]
MPPRREPPARSADKPVPKKTPQPLAGPPASGPLIRLLLKEKFANATIEGSTLAPLVVAQARDGKIILRTGADKSSKLLGTGTGFRLTPANQSRLLVFDGSAYRGSIEVFVNPLGVPVAVNEVDLEEYLRGTVPNELPPSRFPQIEALKAQTVAARTFAVHHLGLNVKRGFDIYSDTRSQVYSGVKVEHPLSDRAIAETRGVTATHEGKPILAVYSSTCGGKTESYAATFGRELPYLKGGVKCSDDNSPFHSWEVKCAGAKVESELNRSRQFGRLRKIEALKRGVSGRIVEMKMIGTKGEAILKGNDVRWILGIRSSLIEDLRTEKDRQGNISQITVKGKGWGHGVGLCQFGAVNLADRGFGYERILKYYYHDIDLKRATDLKGK